jgi:hypothetical protein
MANITIKKADTVTDVVFDAVTGAGGDGNPAVWRQDTGAAAGLPIGLRARMEVVSSNNGPKTARRLVVTVKFPYPTQNSTTTIYSAADQDLFRGEFTLPQAIPSGNQNEFANQCVNLLGSSLFRSMLASGYAAQ